MPVAGICADDGARRYDDAALARAELAAAVPGGLLSAAIADTVERDVEVVRGLRDQWRSLARSSEGVSLPRMRVVALLATVFLTGLLVGAWLC